MRFEPAGCMIYIYIHVFTEEKTSRSRRFCWQMTPDKRANGRSPLATWLRCKPAIASRWPCQLQSVASSGIPFPVSDDVRWLHFKCGLSTAPFKEKVLWALSLMETWLMMPIEFRVFHLFCRNFWCDSWFVPHVLLPGCSRMGGSWCLFHGAWDGHRWSIWLFGKRWHTRGVYISSVDPDGQAEQLGVRPGSANCAVPRVLVCWHRNRFHWNSFGWVHWVCMASPMVAVCGNYLVYAVHIILVSACIRLIARIWQVFVAATPCYISPHEQKCRSVRRQARLHSRLCHSPESETGISEAMASYSIGTQPCSLQVGIRTLDSLDWRRNQHFKWNCWNSSWCSNFSKFHTSSNWCSNTQRYP